MERVSLFYDRNVLNLSNENLFFSFVFQLFFYTIFLFDYFQKQNVKCMISPTISTIVSIYRLSHVCVFIVKYT